MINHRQNKDLDQKEKEIPKLEEEKKKLQQELDRYKSSALANDDQMMKAYEDLRKIESDLKAKAEKFNDLKLKNKYTLKNMALSLQKSDKKHTDIDDTLRGLDNNVEKTSFQSLLQKEPYNLNNHYSNDAANLFFFDADRMPVGKKLTTETKTSLNAFKICAWLPRDATEV